MGLCFPFIVCSPRSGSTLLRAMLDNHSDLAIPPESHFIAPFLHQARSEFSLEALTRVVTAHPRFAMWGLSCEEIWDLEAPPVDARAAFRAMYQTYARHQGKSRFGDKTPGYALDLPGLAELFPEAVFVHLVRDGRDVALSLVQADFGPTTLTEAAAFWVSRAQKARADGRLLGSERYLELRYEDLVVNPEREIRRICGFIRLPFEESMLDHRRNAERIISSTSVPSSHRNLLRPLRKLRDWRTQMTEDQRAAVESVAGIALAEFGYLK